MQKKPEIAVKNILPIVLFYLLTILILAPLNIPSLDTYYYWDWSRHLDLAYYDGSPMIAYVIKLSIILFGDTLFALVFPGIFVLIITSFIVYQSARIFLTKEASFIAMSLWFVSPLVSLDILKQTTYDTPLILFWSLTQYYAIKYIQFNKKIDLYIIGLFTGLLLLSKYSGIILILALILFIITSRYKFLFKKPSFYLSILLGILIFSPVILWNYQHHWESFSYQLATHKNIDSPGIFSNIIHQFFNKFLPSLNVLLLLPPITFWLMKNNRKSDNRDEKKDLIVKFCLIISVTFLSFYLIASSNVTIRSYWLAPWVLTAALLGGYCFEQFFYQQFFRFLIFLYAIGSAFILVNNTDRFNFIKTGNTHIYYHVMQQFNQDYPALSDTVFTSDWKNARMLYFMNKKPNIYTISCGEEANQYLFWSEEMMHKISQKKLDKIIFITRYDMHNCVRQYFDHCARIPTKLYKNIHDIYAYQCSNTKTI